MPLPWLDPNPHSPFPPLHCALREPDGLLAAGGDLSVPRLLNAYRHGIFPWFSQGQPLLWWSPDPRMVFATDAVHVSRRLARQLRGSGWVLRADSCFAQVIEACASVPRPGQDGTWITPAMRDAYVALHQHGHAHSVEVFDGDTLVGGIYGVAVGRMFFGESMFSRRSGGSKAALLGLSAFLHRHGAPLLDAQVENPHLVSMGAQLMPRDVFATRIAELTAQPALVSGWRQAFGQPLLADVVAMQRARCHAAAAQSNVD